MIRIATLCLSAYWIAIFVATHLPATSLPGVAVSDKLCHVIAYAGLSFLLCWAIPTRSGRWGKHTLLALAIAMGYSCLDELTQHFIPGRSCDPWDVAADAVGVLVGWGCYLLARQLLTGARLGRRLIQAMSR